MHTELKRRAFERLIELIIKNNEEQTILAYAIVESYIDAVRTIFGKTSIDVFRNIPLNTLSEPILYTNVRLYFSDSLRFYYYEWKIGQTDYELHIETGDCL